MRQEESSSEQDEELPVDAMECTDELTTPLTEPLLLPLLLPLGHESSIDLQPKNSFSKGLQTSVIFIHGDAEAYYIVLH